MNEFAIGTQAVPQKRYCSVPDCSEKVKAKGFCTKHWKRWKRYGDPLAGRIFVGEPQRFYREVVIPFEGDACLTWPYTKTSHGYGKMTHEGKELVVTRMLCELVHGPAPSPKHEAAHSCGNGSFGCVNKHHLRWATHTENMADKILHGTHFVGEDAPSSKLTEPEVRAIRRLAGRLPQREIAKVFNVHQMTVSDIISGKTWRSVDP